MSTEVEPGQLLWDAAKEGDLVKVKELLAAGADVNFVRHENVRWGVQNGMWYYGHDDPSVLLIAALHGHEEVVRSLVEGGASVSFADRDGRTPLLAAASSRCSGELLVCLVEQGADLSGTDKEKASIILHTARGGRIDVLDWCVAKGLDVSATDCDRDTLLHYAARGGSAEALDWCVEHGLKADALTSKGRSAVHEAALGGSVAALDWCVEHGLKADVLTSNGRSAVHEAAFSGSVAALDWCVEHGLKADALTSDGLCAVPYAAQSGSVTALDWCVEHGLKADALTSDGRSSVHEAAMGGHVAALDWCVEHGLKADVLTTDRRSAVHEGAWGGSVDALDWCVEHGLKADALTSDGRSAVHLAAKAGHVSVLDWCVEHGLKTDALISDGRSAVHLAAKNGQIGALDWFVKNGHHAGLSRPFVPPAGSNSAVIDFYETCRTTALHGLHEAIASMDDETVRRHLLASKKYDRSPSAALMSVVDGNDAFSIAASSDNTLAFQVMRAACEVEPSDMPPILVCCAVGSGLAVARLAGSTDVNAVFTCSDGVERTPLDVAVAYGQVGMIIFLMGLGASRLHLHTQSDLYRVLGRCRASVMNIGRFQSGKSLLTEYLCSFERKLKLGPITVRAEKRPKAIARQAVEQGVDTGATDGFDTHEFSVDVSARKH